LFAPIPPNTGNVDPTVSKAGRHRGNKAREDIHRWLAKVGLTYRTPHQFRHGHAVYALKLAQDVADLKAVSQNLMHSNLSITDGVYGVLTGRDVQDRISTLGEKAIGLGELSKSELKAALEQILADM
jgi:integrase